MIQSHELNALLIRSKKEEWPYPEIFQALKELGVASYEVKIADFDSSYYGSFGTWKEPAPEDFPTHVTISTEFNKQAVLDSLHRHMQKETSYGKFLGEIAAAGVARYTVSMKDRTVTYYGINADDFYSQSVPQIP